MGSARSTLSHEEAQAFVEQVMRTGFMLTEVLGRLLEDLPSDAFPGEEPAEVLLEMVAGTIRPVAEAAGTPALKNATALIGAIGDRTIADLRLAADLARDA